ncbi:MAG: FAD-binding oxidoreductase [Gammaproteobacteria bacterium]
MNQINHIDKTADFFWHRVFFSKRTPANPPRNASHDVAQKLAEKIGDGGELWLNQLFHGKPPSQGGDTLHIYKEGMLVHEILLDQLGKETVIGRHPDADLQLESQKLSMFHTVIRQINGDFFIECLDADHGILIDRKLVKDKQPVKLANGMLVDLPGYRLKFSMRGRSEVESVPAIVSEEDSTIPDFFYTPPPSDAPLLLTPLENRSQLCVWSEGLTRLKVTAVVEETDNAKTFRLVGLRPTLFSYKPGQFITFVLTIDGHEVRRSYSISSSPSRPYVLEVTIKRIPGGLVSNWFCDHVKPGDELTAVGPAGKFTCFNFPANKMLFICAGSGITPIISMARWITDTGSGVDVKLLASFKTPSEILFRKELEMLAARHSSFRVAITVTAGKQDALPWQGYTGRVNEAMLRHFVPDLLERHIYMCGPEPFADNVKNILNLLGYDMRCFHRENFGSGRSALPAGNAGHTLQLHGPRHKVTFAKSGLTVETDENINLLTLAEAYGIELEYSCRMGSCGECEVKCKGRVEMSDDCEIDEKTRNAGFIYACCSTAKADLVIEA